MIEFFTDPVLRGPTIGCMLMALAASLVGVVVFIRRRSLIGESLSHAAYPGVIVAAVLGGPYVLIGAFLSALLGVWTIEWLERRCKVRQDAALCFVLASFFGIGLTLASQVQFTHGAAYKQIEVFLYGQAATMTDGYIWLYAGLTAVVVSVLLLFYKEIKTASFDRPFAKTAGIRLKLVDGVTMALVVLAVIMGLRSVGIVLMSAMLIAPPAAARQYTHRLSVMLFLSAVFGVVSGFLGNVFSVVSDVSLPTGPVIVLVAASICFLSLLFAPKRGVLWRMVRVALFRHRCVQENLLKAAWKRGKEGVTVPGRGERLARARLVSKGLLYQRAQGYSLTESGWRQASRIVRLHRLWEVYLVDYLGVGAERVHHNAEEMEHILTPELERELTDLLDNPQQDPHQQPIPGEVLA